MFTLDIKIFQLDFLNRFQILVNIPDLPESRKTINIAYPFQEWKVNRLSAEALLYQHILSGIKYFYILLLPNKNAVIFAASILFTVDVLALRVQGANGISLL